MREDTSMMSDLFLGGKVFWRRIVGLGVTRELCLGGRDVHPVSRLPHLSDGQTETPHPSRKGSSVDMHMYIQWKWSNKLTPMTTQSKQARTRVNSFLLRSGALCTLKAYVHAIVYV